MGIVTRASSAAWRRKRWRKTASAAAVPTTVQTTVATAGHDEAVPEGRKDLGVAEELAVPGEGEALPLGGEAALVEGEDHEHQDGRVEKDVDEDAEGRQHAARPGRDDGHQRFAASKGLAEQVEQQQDGQGEKERQRRPEGHVARHGELTLDQVPDVDGAGSAEKVRSEVRAQGRDEDEDAARHDAGSGEGNGHAPEGAGGPGAQVRGGLEERPVELLDGGIEGQDHEGQLAVDLSDHHGHVVVKEAEGRQAEAPESEVQQAFGPEDEDPGIHAHEEAGPEGEDHEDKEGVLPPRRDAEAEPVGHGVGRRQGRGSWWQGPAPGCARRSGGRAARELARS